MSKLLFIIKELWKRKSVTRSFLNYRLSQETLKGKTIDIGGGKNADYISWMIKSSGVDFQNFDIKAGAQIDFETDHLPVGDSAYDTVLFLNVMEHIFNYQHIANEVVRIVKPGGQVIGFVPFLMWYHPDHKDFFRYTHEALENIFVTTEAIQLKIEPIAHGPFIAALQMVSQLLPRIMTIPIFIVLYTLDTIYLCIKPAQKDRYALGYLFLLTR